MPRLGECRARSAATWRPPPGRQRAARSSECVRTRRLHHTPAASNKGQPVALLYRQLYNKSRTGSGQVERASIPYPLPTRLPLLSLFYIILNRTVPPARIVQLKLCAITWAIHTITNQHNCYFTMFHSASINVPLHFVKGVRNFCLSFGY